MARLGARLAVEVDERREPVRLTADDGQRQWQAQPPRTDHRGGRPADRDPHRQGLLDRARVHGLVLQRRPMATAPRHALGRAERQQQVQLLGEQRVVVAEVVPEQRKRLDEGAAADQDLGPPARQQVERREVLEHADRVVGRQNRDGARQADALRPRRRRRQHHRRRRRRVVGPVVLADAEHVQANRVGEGDLFEQVAEAGRVGAVGRHLGEGEEAEFHRIIWLLHQANVRAARRIRPPRHRGGPGRVPSRMASPLPS